MDSYDEGDKDQPPYPDRRTFCTGLMLTSAGLVLVAPQLAKAANQDPMVAYSPRKIDGAESLMPGSAIYFNYPSRNDPAVLVRSSEGEYTAYSRRCSHAGCSVEFDGARRCLTCPCHKGAFDARMGLVIFGPPRTPLDEIILQVRSGGHIWAIGKSFGRTTEMIAQSL